jgi:hypothetical protein
VSHTHTSSLVVGKPSEISGMVYCSGREELPEGAFGSETRWICLASARVHVEVKSLSTG